LYDLFNDLQIAELLLLKSLIYNVKDENIKDNLKLAFSSNLSKCNLTFKKEKKGGNANPIIAKLNYKIMKEPTILNIANEFFNKLNKLIKAKKEIQNEALIDYNQLNDDNIFVGGCL